MQNRINILIRVATSNYPYAHVLCMYVVVVLFRIKSGGVRGFVFPATCSYANNDFSVFTPLKVYNSRIISY